MDCNRIETDSTFSTRKDDLDGILAAMESQVAKKDHRPKGLKYLVKPISMTTRATIETRPELKDFSVPKVDLQISFNEIAFNFHSSQLEQAVAFGSALDQMMVAKEYKKFRPDTVLRGNPILLWHFARDAIMEEHVIPKHRQWTWEYMFERIQLRKKYQKVWGEKIKAGKNPSKDLLKDLDDLEADPRLDVFNIIIARQTAVTNWEILRSK